MARSTTLRAKPCHAPRVPASSTLGSSARDAERARPVVVRPPGSGGIDAALHLGHEALRRGPDGALLTRGPRGVPAPLPSVSAPACFEFFRPRRSRLSVRRTSPRSCFSASLRPGHLPERQAVSAVVLPHRPASLHRRAPAADHRPLAMGSATNVQALSQDAESAARRREMGRAPPWTASRGTGADPLRVQGPRRALRGGRGGDRKVGGCGEAGRIASPSTAPERPGRALMARRTTVTLETSRRKQGTDLDPASTSRGGPMTPRLLPRSAGWAGSSPRGGRLHRSGRADPVPPVQEATRVLLVNQGRVRR